MDMKNSLIKKEMIFIAALVAAAILLVAFAPLSNMEFIVIGVFAAVLLAVVLLEYFRFRAFYRAAQVISQNSGNIENYVNSVFVPIAVTAKNGRIFWYNPAFLVLAGPYIKEKNMSALLSRFGKPDRDKKITFGDKKYAKEQNEVFYKNKTYYIFRFIDEEKSVQASDLFKIVLGVVMQVQMDNYDDLLRSIRKEEHYAIMAEVEKIVAKNAANLHGFYQQYAKDKFLMVFERRYLAILMQGKFDLLSEVKKIPIAGNVKPTLSIGVGVGKSFDESSDYAAGALDLALGRGGDQAVIKEKKEYRFYGGGQQAPQKRVRVRSRMFAAALRNLMEQSGNIFIMGHTVPDLDAIGSAMGLVACARYLGKRVHVVLDKENAAIDALIAEIRAEPDYKSLLISPDDAEKLMDQNSMLIVVDTQIAAHTLAPQLLDKAQTLVVIDHHLRGTSYIDTATLYYHEPYASSASELVTEIVQYFSDRISLKPIDAEALLAGITIDTKGFSFKTGVRTFEAASYLRKVGADTTSIRHLFQDDLKTFNARARVVQNARMVAPNIAVSAASKDEPNPELLAAQAADSLIGIRGINASFVLCESGDQIVISGRSLGQVNVQRVLEKLGGGGHSTIAGAQLKTDMEDARKKLADAIQEYLKESS